MTSVEMLCEINFVGQESFFSNLVYWMKIQNLTVLDKFSAEMIINAKLSQDESMSEDLKLATEAVVEVSRLSITVW